MIFDVEVTNFRSFTGLPARFRVGEGFTGFLGLNNAGKSSLLRLFWELRPIIAAVGDALRNTDQRVQPLLRGETTSMAPFSVSLQTRTGERPFPAANTDPIRLTVYLISDSKPQVGIVKAKTFTLSIFVGHEISVTIGLENGESMSGAEWSGHADADNRYNGEYQSDRGYIADLRNLIEALSIIAGACYVGPFRTVVPSSGDGRYYDISIGSDFIQELGRWISGDQPAYRDAVIAMEARIRAVFALREFHLSTGDDGKSLMVNVDGRSFNILEQGSGLAHFVVVAAHVLMNQPTLLLIDEPELNLHPALQVEFLLLLATYVRGGLVFATHSLGLARTVTDQLYCVQKNEDGQSMLTRYEGTPQLSPLLGQLGFLSNSTLQYESILLVEGTTEVRVMQQWLRMYGAEHRVAVIPLGGTSLIKQDSGLELGEIRRLHDRIYAVIDSDREHPDGDLSKNIIGFKTACEEIGISCLVLERRTTENYFSDAAVKKIFGSSLRALKPYESIDAVPGWSKPANWKVASEMTKDDLAGTDLGALLGLLAVASD